MSHKAMFVRCDYCSQQAELIDSEKVYGRSYGLIYICWPCDARIGVHKGTTRPLGRLANKELREWKKRAHAAFDPLWKSKQMTRPDAYRWLAKEMDIKDAARDCHIGMFDVADCQRVVAIMEDLS
jgi:hypothetical protein